jgi:hypothetical protein
MDELETVVAADCAAPDETTQGEAHDDWVPGVPGSGEPPD